MREVDLPDGGPQCWLLRREPKRSTEREVSHLMAAPEVLVVVAAGPGLGRSVALRFAREGAAVGLVARSVGSAEALAAELRAAGSPEVAVAAGDVGDEPALRAALGELRERARARDGDWSTTAPHSSRGRA